MLIILYIKIHNETGLKYFGKTTSKDPHKYKGSGKYWKKHIKKHGYNVTTIIFGTYDNEADCSTAALNFSTEHNITESTEWANLQDENGLSGAPIGHTGHIFTDEQRAKLSALSTTRWTDPNYRHKVVNSQKQRFETDPTLSIRSVQKGIANQINNGTYEQAKQAREEGRKRFLESLSEEEKNIKYKYFKSPRPQSHKDNISKSLKGKIVSDEHKRKLSLSRQKHTGILVDHNNDHYEIHTVFLKKYNILPYFLNDLSLPISKKICVKLGLDYEWCKHKTKAELGFRFILKEV